MDSLGNEPIEMVALGRPFSLGMFYDCRSDKLIPGITLWDKEKLDKDKSVNPQPNTECKIVASESISDKSSSLDVSASLKASFLGGLVKVKGSAKYLNDNKKSTKQARVTLQYKTTTVFKTLSMNQLGTGNLKHCQVMDKGLATHVVTGILYGAQAFFVFDQQISEYESVQDIQGNLKVMIQKIPQISIEGSGALTMKDTEIEKVNKFSCTFHGDFHLEKSPTAFEEAVKVYQDLPRLLGPNKENVVPVTVHLLPLSALDSKASRLVRQISLSLVTEAENVLENLGELEMWCNDILNSPVGQNFSQLSQRIKSFKALCSQFKLGLQGTLAQKLPSIRGGGEEESALAEVLKEAAESPFSRKSLDQWMRDKDKEVNTIKTLMKLMKNTETVSSENALTDKVCDSENALVFVLTSLGSTEPFLSELDQYLRRSQSDSSDAPQPRPWYSSKDVINSVRRKAKLFSDFAEANKDEDKQSIRFLAMGLEDKNHEGSAIYLYEDGFRVSEDFALPSKPAAVSVGEVTHNTVSLHFSAPSEGVQNITGYRVEFCEEGQEEWNQRPQAEAGAVTVPGLSPNTEYSIRVRAITAVGVGPAAPKTSIRTSKPCGPPEELTGTVFSTRIRVRWRRPQVGRGVNIHGYIVEYGQMQEKIQWKSKQSQTEEMVISGLRPETTYTIRVLCDCGEHGTSLKSSTLTLTTTAKAGFEQSLTIMNIWDKDQLLRYVRNYKPDGASHVRILLYGPLGSGKASFINSVGSAVTGEQIKAETFASYETTSFTVEYRTHRFRMRDKQRRVIPIVFNDTMGLEDGEGRGVLPKDVILAMKGHVKDGYKFNPSRKLSEKDEFYKRDPTIDDKVHVLVFVLNANSPSFDPSVIQKMKEIREAARDLGIPHVAVVTHIDNVCEEIDNNITTVSKSRPLKNKMEMFSDFLGIPVNRIFPVRNNYEGKQKNEVDALLLTALIHMLNYGDDFIDNCYR